MQQIVDFNQQLKDQIMQLENDTKALCTELEAKFMNEFQKYDVLLKIDCLRTLKGEETGQDNLFQNHYESYIEIGLEDEHDYYPNAYIPLWKCKKEMFQSVGYFTRQDITQLESKMIGLIQEMIVDFSVR